MKNRAFSLIELLVVCTILAILAAILLPVIARAKAASQRTVCQSNLRQIGVAINLYSADADDRYMRWLDRTPAIQSWPDWIAPYAGRREIFRCPADTGAKAWDASLAASPTFDKHLMNRYCSYWLNAYIPRFSGNLYASVPGGGVPLLHTDLSSAATTILLADGPAGPGFDAYKGSPSLFAQRQGPLMPQPFYDSEKRHLGLQNFLMADLHTKAVAAGEILTTRNDSQTDRLVDPADPNLKQSSNDGSHLWWRP